jgi:hypothetical protein
MGRQGDRGAVTVEAAIALCALMVVLALAIGGVAAAGAQVRCVDAAREAARLVARGQSDRARQAASTIAPAGAWVSVRVVGDEITVDVSARLVGPLPGLSVAGRAVAVLEPGQLDSVAADADGTDGVDAEGGDGDRVHADAGAGTGQRPAEGGPP